MSDARHALMSAVHIALTTDPDLGAMLGGDRVFDHVPRAAPFPFVEFGECLSRALDGDETPAVRHDFDVTVHSRAAGRREASDIAARIGALLESPAFAVAGFRLVLLRMKDAGVAASRDRRAYRARLRFEAITEIE